MDGRPARQRRRPHGVPGWLRWSGRVCLLGCVVLAPAAQATRQGAAAAPLLLVSQWIETDALGRVRAQSAQAQMQPAGSTEAGLLSSWSVRLNREVDASDLLLAPVPWLDPAPVAPGVAGHGQLTRPGAADPDPRSDPNTLARLLPRLTEEARRHCEQAAPALAARLAARLVGLAATEAWFNFRQALPIAGQRRTLVWTLHVDATGTWFAATPLLDSPGPLTLQVRYTSLAAESGLPSGLGHADGGWLRWEARDGNGQLAGAPGARDTQGAFDGPRGLACLLGTRHAQDCPAGQETIPAMMERLGAGHADLDLTTALRPAYAVSADGQRFAVAQLAVARTLESPDPGCRRAPWRYVNAYQAAFRLEARREHYVLAPSAGWQLQSLTRVRQDTPLLPWRTLSLALTAGQLDGLDAQVIDPERGTLISAALFPAELQRLALGPVQCRARVAPG